MNILHLCTRDQKGAGIAAFRLHSALKQMNYNSKLLVVTKELNDSDVLQLRTNRYINKIINNIRKFILFETNSDKKFYFEDQRFSPFLVRNIIKTIQFNPDVIIVHWISGFINFKQLYKLHKRTNAQIILHFVDMALLTGGCHYAWECTHYYKNCGHCPALYSKCSKDLSWSILKYKKHYLKKISFRIVSPTQWLCNQIQKSSLFKKCEIEKILIAVNSDIFKPALKSNVRKGISANLIGKVIFIGSESFREERKGAKYLIDALKILIKKYNYDSNSLTLLVAGKIFIIDEYINSNYLIHYMDYITSEVQLASCYQSADLFVCSSIEDSGPMMINESIVTGTPVVAFEMGVASDLIINYETGYIAKNKDSDDLAFGINKILKLDNEQYQIYSKNCRKIGLELCNLQKQTNKFVNLFKPNI